MIANILFMHEQLPDSIRQHVVAKTDNTPIILPVKKVIISRKLKDTQKVVVYTLDKSYRQEFKKSCQNVW
jgi:hypothetical protein